VKITIESTGRRAKVDGVPCSFWDGVSESGTRCVVFVHRIAVNLDDDHSEFESGLMEAPKPDKVEIGGMRQDWG
jgi:hypothetical protein